MADWDEVDRLEDEWRAKQDVLHFGPHTWSETDTHWIIVAHDCAGGYTKGGEFLKSEWSLEHVSSGLVLTRRV